MVPLPPELGLHSAADMFRHPGHRGRALLLGGAGGGVHSHDGQGKKEGWNRVFIAFPFFSAGDKVDGDHSDSNLHWTIYI